MTDAPIRIATAQFPPEQFATRGEYRDKLARWVAEAAGHGADLLVFPEYGALEWAGVLGQHSLAQSLTAVSDAMAELDEAHAQLSARHRVHILAASGPCVRPGGRTVNAARLFAPNGRCGVQEKLIMTPFERGWGISPGSPLRVFETTLGTIGIAICYDSEFPLLVRAQVEAGARLILIPSCTEFASGWHRVRAAAMARALENTCVTVVSPLIGNAAWSPAIDVNFGAAGAYRPADHAQSDSGVIVEGTPGVAGWIYADVELGDMERLVTSGEMRNRLDWSLQPGAGSLSGLAEIVSLL